MKIIDDQLISDVVEQAKQSPRLRMNYNFHESLQDKCHRFLNALEPGTFISHLLNIELLGKGYLTNFVFCVVGAVTVLWLWKKLFGSSLNKNELY